MCVNPKARSLREENGGKMAETSPRFGHGLCGQRHGLALNWVDRPRTSVDERAGGGVEQQSQERLSGTCFIKYLKSIENGGKMAEM